MASPPIVPGAPWEHTLQVPGTDRNRIVFSRFVLWYALIPVVAYLSAFLLVRSASYERWSPSHWSSRLDFAFDTAHIDADILIFGDSSAFIGVDPRVVGEKLGLKAVVLPATIGSVPITGELAMQRYLASNKRPRLLVIMVPPWNMDYLHDENSHLYEGEEMLFRHGTWAEIGSFAAHHPVETAAFPLRMFSILSPGAIRSSFKSADRERPIASALGHFDDTEPYPALTAPCTFPARLLSQQRDATIDQLVQKYKRTLQVMVYVSPVPACSNVSQFQARSYAALGAEPPAVFPESYFLGDLGYAHVEPPFVPLASVAFAKAVGQRLGIPVTSSLPVSSPLP